MNIFSNKLNNMNILNLIQSNHQFKLVIFSNDNLNYKTYYIRSIISNKNIWKSFGFNYCGQCGVGKKDKYIYKPTTFFEGKIYEWKFYENTIYIQINDKNGKNIWKSFGDNRFGQCGVGKIDNFILIPTTFFEGEIYN